MKTILFAICYFLLALACQAQGVVQSGWTTTNSASAARAALGLSSLSTSNALNPAYFFLGGAASNIFATNMTGDVSMDTNGATTLAASGVSAGTATKVTVDSKGRVTATNTIGANDISAVNPSALSGSGTIPTNAFKAQPIVNKTFVVISNTSSETMMMDSNNVTGGWGGSLVIPTNFWNAGAGFIIRINGFMTSTGGGNATMNLKLVPAGVAIGSGMTIGTTGAVTANSQSVGNNMFEAFVSYDGTNLRCVGHWLTYNVNDRVFTALNTAYTLTNTVAYELCATLTWATPSANNNFVPVHAEVIPVPQ